MGSIYKVIISYSFCHTIFNSFLVRPGSKNYENLPDTELNIKSNPQQL
nr:MAG TPA: hypothetical protein [Bacteriophage sp.]